MTIPNGYRYALPMSVRFADLDAMGHLNNATYLTYIEQARIAYVHDVCGWDGNWKALGMILARSEIDYRLPVSFGDQVTIYLRVSRIGSKSFDFQAVITAQRADDPAGIAAEAKAVMVAYDYQQNTSIPILATWRERILAYEPALS